MTQHGNTAAEHAANSDRLVILAYVSDVKPELKHDPITLNLTNTQILGQAHHNNPEHHITGVLYYGDGHFFQCLEGSQSEVKDMFDTVKHDPRQEAVTPLLTVTTKHRLFDTWSMKFVEAHHEIRDFFAQHGLAEFEPKDLTGEDLKLFLQLLAKL